MGDMTGHPYSEAIEAFADALAKLDGATAYAVAAQARELARAALLRQEIQKGRASGEPINEDEVFGQLLAEAEADIEREGS